MRLDTNFEADLQDAMLDDVERKLVGERDNLMFQLTQFVRGRLERYARDADYRVQSVLDSLEPIEVTRTETGIEATVGWSHPAFPYFEFGTSDHTIEGNPVLSFVWEERHDPPDWVREEFDAEGDGYRVFLPEVEVAGVRETRAVRDGLNQIRRQIQ